MIPAAPNFHQKLVKSLIFTPGGDYSAPTFHQTSSNTTLKHNSVIFCVALCVRAISSPYFMFHLQREVYSISNIYVGQPLIFNSLGVSGDSTFTMSSAGKNCGVKKTLRTFKRISKQSFNSHNKKSAVYTELLCMELISEAITCFLSEVPFKELLTNNGKCCC